MWPVQRDAKGWKVKTRFLTFHPVSYGVGSLARLSIGLHPEGRRLMFHYFPRNEDPGPEMHDHPWPFWTLVLWGSYTDISVQSFEPLYAGPCGGKRHSCVVRDRLRAGSIRHRKALHRHRTPIHKPTFTVVFRGATERMWCEGTTEDWKCEGSPADFDATLGMR